MKNVGTLETEIKMNYIPLSKNAKECFKRYVNRGFKIYKEINNGILFVDSKCDISSDQSYCDTMEFAFHLGNDEIEAIKWKLLNF